MGIEGLKKAYFWKSLEFAERLIAEIALKSPKSL
jgi:hypothetical protein